jgi:hypothetical protein
MVPHAMRPITNASADPDRHRDIRPRPVRLALEPPKIDARDGEARVVEGSSTPPQSKRLLRYVLASNPGSADARPRIWARGG